MVAKCEWFTRCTLTAAFLSCFGAALPAQASTITWTDWSSATAGNPGTASGTIASSPSLTVSYSGQDIGLTSTPSWTPTSSFSGGSVANAPPQSFHSVALTGGTSATNTLTFSSPVTDPALAIWSLGAAGNPASFNFTASEPFTLEAGGPSAEYGGSSITVSGNNVLGTEGNGVIQFSGTFSTLTWTNPTFEDFFAFTVGSVTSSPTPEPAALGFIGIGLCALAYLRRTRSR